MGKLVVVIIAAAGGAFARWFVRTANAATSYRREPLHGQPRVRTRVEAAVADESALNV